MISSYERSFGIRQKETSRQISEDKGFKKVHMPTIKNHRFSDPENSGNKLNYVNKFSSIMEPSFQD